MMHVKLQKHHVIIFLFCKKIPLAKAFSCAHGHVVHEVFSGMTNWYSAKAVKHGTMQFVISFDAGPSIKKV